MNENRILRQLNEYLNYKHSLGFKLKHEETVLKCFAKYTLENDYDGPLTMDIVMKWTASGNQSDKTMGRKVEVIRPFSKYVAAFDHEAKSIYSLIYKNVHDRPVPYIYTEAETVQLMKQCQRLYSPDGIRARTIETVIGLLWSAGLRPSEPINLVISDVELERGILHVRKTKFSKERFVPLDSSVIRKLTAYKSWIEQMLGARSPIDAFFYTTGGKPLKVNSLAYAFQKVRPCIDAHPIGYPFVRLYDFRHTMACNTIRRWTEEGIDVNSNLHVLSTYLGHVKPEDTYWYLSATPGMMELCCSKYEDMFGGDYDEV